MRSHTAQITRQALLEAALVVLECGRGEFTLEAVAAQARVSKSGLLHHFATKRNLLCPTMVVRLAVEGLALSVLLELEPPRAEVLAVLKSVLETLTTPNDGHPNGL